MSEADRYRIKDVKVKEVWKDLAAHESSTLVDVRTVAEWSYVGFVDLSQINKKSVFIEWQMFPTYEINAGFVTKLDAELKNDGIDNQANLFFMCRSGVRSLAAAKAMASVGYRHCFNVENGFEGPPDAEQKRGKLSGWKAEKLPWVQK
ncbi:MAG: rhodanese-like domain-containing protein [Pseudomonadota bacterium]